jgi:ubiquinone/menaquinone biosynthesis C-methylase UbiE
MAQAQAFNAIAFKQKVREEWSDAADGWRRWCHVVEGEDGGQRHSAKLIDLVRVRPGASVLDVGGGYGAQSYRRARRRTQRARRLYGYLPWASGFRP